MRRRVLYITGAVTLLVVLAAGALLLTPAERIGALLAARASAALDRDVTVERFRMRLLPRPAIALEGVVIGGPRGFATDTATAFAAVSRVELRPRLLPLLRRHVVVDEVAFEGPRVLIAVDSAGESNVPRLRETADGGEPGDAELRVRRLRVSNGRLEWQDARDGTVVRLEGIRQAVRIDGSVSAGELARMALRGDLAIDDIDAELPGRLAWPLRDVRLAVSHRIVLDRAADRLDLDAVDVTLQDVPLHLSGVVMALGQADARQVELKAGTGRFDVARLVAALPRGLLEGSSGDLIEGTSGKATLDVSIRGRAGSGAVPDVAGTLAVEDAALSRGRHGVIADRLSGVVAFSLDSVTSSGVSGRLLGEPLHVALRVHDFAEPRGTVALRTALAMREAVKLGLLPDGAEGSGRIGVDVQAAGTFTDAASLALNGQVDLAGVTLRLAALEQPAVVDAGRILLQGSVAATQSLQAHVGGSDLRLDFTADDWLPWVLGDTTHVPVVTFDARSARFSADEIFGVEQDRHTYSELFFARLGGHDVDGRAPAVVAQEMGLGMPAVPPIRLDGRVRAAQLINGGVAFDDVDVTVAARGGVLDVQAASFRMMGGGVHLTGRLGLAAGGGAGGTQPLELDYAVNGVAARQFLDRFAPLREHITGDLLLGGVVRMNLDEHLLPVTASLAGAGTIAFVDGELVNWPLLKAIGERLGRPLMDTVAFRDLSGRYTFAGERVILDETVLDGRDLSIRASGSFDFAGNLDLGATLYVPQAWAQRIPGAPAAFLVNTVSDSDGRVPVGARIAGSAAAPVVRLDLSEAGTRVAAAAQAAARQQARQAGTRVVDEVTDRLPPRDSIAARADSLRRAVEDNVANRLRRIIRPGGGG